MKQVHVIDSHTACEPTCLVMKGFARTADCMLLIDEPRGTTPSFHLNERVKELQQ